MSLPSFFLLHCSQASDSMMAPKFISLLPVHLQPVLLSLSHFRVPLVAALALAFPIYSNYRAYIALGPGGLPYNATGWLIATFLKPFGRETKSVGMYELDPDKDSFLDADGVDSLVDLRDSSGAFPKRAGQRPRTSWHSIPHRQLEHKSTQDMENVRATSFPTVYFPELADVHPCSSWSAIYEHSCPTTLRFLN